MPCGWGMTLAIDAAFLPVSALAARSADNILWCTGVERINVSPKSMLSRRPWNWYRTDMAQVCWRTSSLYAIEFEKSGHARPTTAIESEESARGKPNLRPEPSRTELLDPRTWWPCEGWNTRVAHICSGGAPHGTMCKGIGVSAWLPVRWTFRLCPNFNPATPKGFFEEQNALL